MKIKAIILMGLFSATSLLVAAEKSGVKYEIPTPKAQIFTSDWKSLEENYKCPEWFRDAKLGIFIHWGVYSVPAFGNEWYPRYMYVKDSREYNHHREKWGKHTEFGYKDFIPMFKAEKFDADEWVKLFKKAGAKYIIPVAEHHDGFAMYDSKLNPWNSVKMGLKKDIIALLKKAIEKEGLIFGFSFHRAENPWFYGGGMGFPSDVKNTDISLYGDRLPVRETYADDWGERFYPNLIEVVEKYKPSLVWFDWTVNHVMIKPAMDKFFAHYYNRGLDWGKGVVVNTKHGFSKKMHVWDMERGKAGELQYYPWQTDTSIGKLSWSHIEGEENKDAGQIVRDLVDIVSKNGNLLLNVGPKADGTITEEQKAVLLNLGNWLKINGEGIYATRPWKIYGEGETKTPQGAFTDNQLIPYKYDDLRFTAKGSDLYVFALAWSDNGEVIVKSLTKENIGNAKLLNVKMLGSKEKIKFEQTSDGLKLFFPKNKPCDYAYAFKLSFDKPAGEHLKSTAVK